MASIISGYEYDIFISYRHNDNTSGWVTEFVHSLKQEIAATIKEPISVYFDKNPNDGLLETHNVDKSLEGKLKCLIFIPILSQTYCDPKSFAWEHEFVAFNTMAKEDQFGRDIKLANGNVASRILPVRIHDLDEYDKSTIEGEIGGTVRAIEFIYKEPGVNRPLKISDSRTDNLNKTEYRNQVNKVANSLKEIMSSIRNPATAALRHSEPDIIKKTKSQRKSILMVIAGVFIALAGYILYQQLSTRTPRVAIDRSIAVLPFADMSPNHDQEYFGDGIAEEIINVLAQSEDLKVISRSSSFQFKSKNEDLRKVGEMLGVATVLEGSIRKSDDNLRITAQLINTSDGTHLWSRTYDRLPGDIFSVQDEIANAVAIELNATLRTGATARADWNEEAWKEYLLGWSYFNRFRDYERAKEHFLKSISLDSTHANVYTFLHICVINLTRPGQRDEEIPYLKKALQLDSNSAEAKIALARQYLTHYQFKEAEQQMNMALKSGPKNVVVLRNAASILRALKKHDQAIQLVERALEFGPLDGTSYAILAALFEDKGQIDDAIKHATKARSLSNNRNDRLVGYLLQNNQVTEAILASKGATGRRLDMNEVMIHSQIDAVKAKVLYNQFIKKYGETDTYDCATVSMSVADSDAALTYLEKAHDKGYVVWLRTDRTFNPLHSHPRYIALIKKLNFPE